MQRRPDLQPPSPQKTSPPISSPPISSPPSVVPSPQTTQAAHTSSPPAQAPSSGNYGAFTVPNYGQCGGNSFYCKDLGLTECKDAVWSLALCNPGSASFSSVLPPYQFQSQVRPDARDTHLQNLHIDIFVTAGFGDGVLPVCPVAASVLIRHNQLKDPLQPAFVNSFLSPILYQCLDFNSISLIHDSRKISEEAVAVVAELPLSSHCKAG